MATERLANAALSSIGSHSGAQLLSQGMSSMAWLGTVDGVDYVVRVPVGDGKRPTPNYTDEARLLDDLYRRGANVAPIRIVRIEDYDCAVAPRMPGKPVEPDDWSDELIHAAARFFTVLHATSPDLAVEHDIVRRFHLASIWPFDGTKLGNHAISDVWPDRVASIEALREDIIEAASGPQTVNHTDLHPRHLLVRGTGDHVELTGMLDFGDALAGAAAWDHACFRYYHGDDVHHRVAAAMGSAAPSERDIDLIGIAWVLYKLAKTPERMDLRPRIERMLTRGLA